jgi:hypothetical protein
MLASAGLKGKGATDTMGMDGVTGEEDTPVNVELVSNALANLRHHVSSSLSDDDTPTNAPDTPSTSRSTHTQVCTG